MMKFLIVMLALSTASIAMALTPEQEGLAIAKNMQEANKGFVGEDSEMELVLIDAKGTRVTRVLQGMTKEIEKDGDMSISIFMNPKDVKGTKMLTHSHKVGDDDQWLFLPSLRKVKRISSRSKSSSFMASEFSYEDLGSQEVDKYTFKLIKKIKGGWVLERTPKEKSGYSKMITYISKKYMSSVKVEYYDRKNELLKVATFSDWKQYQVGKKKLWRASEIHMKNVQTKKESIFTWKKRKIGVNHPERLFRKSALK